MDTGAGFSFMSLLVVNCLGYVLLMVECIKVRFANRECLH